MKGHMDSQSVSSTAHLADQSDAPFSRSCMTCGEPIPEKRMKATNGKATRCVPCLEAYGDVLRTKRFDEYTPSGERVETMFTENPLIEIAMRRSNQMPVTADDLAAACGDDSHIVREYNQPTIQIESPLYSERDDKTEDDEETNVGREPNLHHVFNIPEVWDEPIQLNVA